MRTALVLSGNSFVGRHVLGALPKHCRRVAATARRAQPGFLRCDLTDSRQVEAAVKSVKPDWVIQCAGATAAHQRAEMNRLHIDGTLNLLRAVSRYAPKATTLLFGSAAEYGQVDAVSLPLSENHVPNPLSAFGQSKLAQFHLAQSTAMEWNLSVLIVRPFNILGPGLPEHYLAAGLGQRLREALAAQQRGDFPVANSEATRDWVDVRDVVSAVIGLLARASPPPGKWDLFNIATGQETTVLALAEKLCALAGGFTAIPGSNVSSRSGILRSCGDAMKLRQATGWRPRFSWQQSLAETWYHAAFLRAAAS